MKCLKSVAVCLALLCLLTGCTPGAEGIPAATTQLAATEDTASKTVLYKNSVRQFLMPVQEHSWERKHRPECVMLHFTSAVMWSKENPFDMDLVRRTFIYYDVSTHYVIDRTGTVYCYVPENRVAWHAGEGTWNNDPKYTNQMNQYAIGIELVGIGSREDMAQYLSDEEYDALNPSWIGYTDAQYESLKKLVLDICGRYDIPLTREYVLGHQDYSPTKNDPGELFDWSRILP